jgi:hypothetical protein
MMWLVLTGVSVAFSLLAVTVISLLFGERFEGSRPKKPNKEPVVITEDDPLPPAAPPT